jgi:hypothetical protein
MWIMRFNSQMAKKNISGGADGIRTRGLLRDRQACWATTPQLHIQLCNWCRREDLNPQPTDYKSVALPVELQRQMLLSSLALVHANAIMVGADGIEPPTLCL